MNTLYLIATPIGNLEDITHRGLRLLAEVALIAAEDTRQTKKLLTHYGIHTRVISYHEHSRAPRIEKILSALAEGDVALVSDAGTPGLNDPGYDLVRAALAAGHEVRPVPGPSAPIAALVASGLPTDAFLYLGYLPRKSSERRRKLAEVARLPYTLIFLETPHRLLDSLIDLRAILGERSVAVARELTKIHEEIYRGNLSNAWDHFQKGELRGEITLVIEGAQQLDARWSEAYLMDVLQSATSKKESPTSLAARLAQESGWSRREIYQRLTHLPGGSDVDRTQKKG